MRFVRGTEQEIAGSRWQRPMSKSKRADKTVGPLPENGVDEIDTASGSFGGRKDATRYRGLLAEVPGLLARISLRLVLLLLLLLLLALVFVLLALVSHGLLLVG